MGDYETRFERVVCEAFAGISSEFGLSMTCRDELYVVFENERINLLVMQKHIWDRVDIAIGLKNRPDHYDLDRVAAWSGAQAIPLQVGDAQVLRRLLPQTCALLRDTGEQLLRGKEDAFDRLALFSHARDVAYTKQFTLNAVLERAHAAWQAHDYGLVVDLLSGMSADLSKIDKTRLRLAAKYLEHERA